MINIDWTEEKKEAVISAIQKFLIDNNFTCGESIMQSDFGTEGSLDIMSDIVDIIEPYDDEDEEG